MLQNPGLAEQIVEIANDAASGKIKLEIPPEALAATLAPASEDVASSEAEDRA